MGEIDIVDEGGAVVETVTVEGDPDDYSVERTHNVDDVDGTELEWGSGYTLRVRRASIQLLDNDDSSILIIKRDGWELDPYVCWTSIPSGLGCELRTLGFTYEESYDTMHDSDP